MTNIPDYRGRIESDQPQSFFHRIAAKIPGYTGYQDKERRREADKELRMFLARRYREQHADLLRTQQQIARSRHLESIGEVDRLAGVLQRFIDKLETATQGYAGLFDPVKVDETSLDQLYTFDAALTDGLQQVTDAVQAVSRAAQQGSGTAPAGTSAEAPDLSTALSSLSSVLDELLRTWNRRNDVIMSGRPMPAADYDKFRASVGASGGAAGYGAQAPGGRPGYASPGGAPAAGPAPSAGQPAGGAAYGGGSPAPGYGAPPAGGQPYPPYTGGPAPEQATGPLPGGGPAGAPYQPYAGPQTGGAGTGEAATRRLDPSPLPPSGDSGHVSDVQGGPTGGPTGGETRG